jgi:hypothetical protein
MAIPASVTLYANWVHGSLVSTTYTQATPEIPNAHTWGLYGSRTVVTASPWNGQTLADFTAAWNDRAETTVSSATVQATSGRILVEFDTISESQSAPIFALSAATASNGRIRIERGAANLTVTLRWGSWDGDNTVDLGTAPTGPFVIELIYNTQHATANQRLQARTWAVGGTPGSFSNSTSSGGSAGTTNQFTSLFLGSGNDWSEYRIGRVIIANSTTDDLSVVSEEAAAATSLPRRALDGPFYGALRGSVR